MTATNTEALRLVPDIVTLTTATQLDEEQRATLIAKRLEEQQAALLAKRLEALSHPTRLRVLRALAGVPENHRIGVNALVRLIGVATQGTVSRHIQTLVLAGFLQCTEAGGSRHYYHVRRNAISEALSELLSYTRIAEAVAETG